MPTPGRRRRGRCSTATRTHHAGPVGRSPAAGRVIAGAAESARHAVGQRRRTAIGSWAATGSVYSLQGCAVPGQRRTVACTAASSAWGRRRIRQRLLPARRPRATSSRSVTRKSFGSMAGHRLNAPIIALAPIADRPRLLAARPRRRSVQLRRRALLGLDGRHAAQRTDHLDGCNANRARLLAAGIGRWRVQLRRRAVPRFDRWSPLELADHLDGASPSGQRLLAGRARRWHLQLRRARSTAAWSASVSATPPPGVQIRPTLTGHGYFLLGGNGTVWPFGDAKTSGNTPPLTLSNFAVDLVVRK